MLEVEQTVIGTLISNPEKLVDVQHLLIEDDFTTSGHRDIFRTIVQLSESGVDVTIFTVGERLNNLDYLSQVAQAGSPNIGAHAQLLASNGYKKRLIERIDQAREIVMASKDVNEQQDAIANMTNGLEVKGEEFKSFSAMAKDTVRRLDDRMKGISKEGLKTGFDRIDERLMGIGSDDLVIVAGRPSMGKTTYAMNIAENVARDGGNVLVFSMEMSEEQIMDRIHSSLSGVKQRVLKIGKGMSEHDQTLANAGFVQMNRIKKNMLIIDRPAMELSHLTNITRKCDRKRKIDLVVIDYLQLMQCKAASRFEEISVISRGLKALAKTIHAPVIALSQLSRKVDERSEKRPVNSDLRESGQIEQDADIIQFLYRDEVYNEQSPNAGLAEIITSKFRNGEIGNDVLESQLDRSRFANTNRFVTVSEAPQKRPYKL